MANFLQALGALAMAAFRSWGVGGACLSQQAMEGSVGRPSMGLGLREGQAGVQPLRTKPAWAPEGPGGPSKGTPPVTGPRHPHSLSPPFSHPFSLACRDVAWLSPGWVGGRGGRRAPIWGLEQQSPVGRGWPDTAPSLPDQGVGVGAPAGPLEVHSGGGS